METANEVGQSEICRFTETVWNSILNLEVAQATGDDGTIQGRFLTSCVQITGAWDGAVVVRCSEQLAKRCASAMFCNEQTSPEEVRDAMGEIVNMIGGNVKSILPEPSKLSLPAIAGGSDYEMSVPGTRVMAEVSFVSEGQPLQVRVLVRS